MALSAPTTPPSASAIDAGSNPVLGVYRFAFEAAAAVAFGTLPRPADAVMSLAETAVVDVVGMDGKTLTISMTNAGTIVPFKFKSVAAATPSTVVVLWL